MNNKNVYSLNNTFEGKIGVDWKGKIAGGCIYYIIIG